MLSKYTNHTMALNLSFLLSVITGILETLIYGGLVFGWNSISYVLRKEGYFTTLCNDTNLVTVSNSSQTLNQVCQEQEESLILVYTMATFAVSVSSLFNGMSLDMAGTFITRCMGTAVFTFGVVLVSMSTPDSSILTYAAAMCCIGAGGMCLLIVNLPLGGVFPSRRSTIITSINGAFDSSAVVFFLVKIAYENGINVQASFIVIAVSTLFIWVRTVFLMPLKHVPFIAEQDFKLGVLHHVKCCKDKDEEKKQECTVLTPDGSNRSLISCVLTTKFWLNTFFYSICLLRMNVFFSTSGPWLLDLSEGDDDTFATYTNVLGTVLLFGCFCAPMNGVLVDKLLKVYKQKTKYDSLIATKKVLAISLFITSLLVVLFSISTCIPLPFFTYASFILLILFRAFLFGGLSTYIAMMFPSQHFGKLFGITDCIGAMVSTLQFPLGSFVLRQLDGNFVIFNIGTVVVCAATFIHPIVLFMKSRNQKKFVKGNFVKCPKDDVVMLSDMVK